MEPFDFNDLRHSLPSLQASRPSTPNANQAFYLPVAAHEASSAPCSGSDFNALRRNLPSLANSSDTARDAYQPPYPPVTAQEEAPSLTRSGLRRDMTQNVQPTSARVSKPSRREKNKWKAVHRNLSKQEGWYLTGNEAKAFKTLEKNGYLAQSDKKAQVAFFREHFFGKKEYGWATNTDGNLEWSGELFQRGGLSKEELAAARERKPGRGKGRKKKKNPQVPVKNILEGKAFESQSTASFAKQSTAVTDHSAMETDTAPVPNPPATPADKEPFENQLLNFLSHCTDAEAANIGREGFINELALQIGKDETSNLQRFHETHEIERGKYAGLTYKEHKDLERMREIPEDALPLFVIKRREILEKLLENKHKQPGNFETRMEVEMEIRKDGETPFDKTKRILQSKPKKWSKKDRALLRRSGFENIHKSKVWARMMGNEHEANTMTTVTQPPAIQLCATPEEKKLIGKEFVNFIENDNQAAQFGENLIDEVALRIAKVEHTGKPYTFKYEKYRGYTFENQNELERMRAIVGDLRPNQKNRLNQLENLLRRYGSGPKEHESPLNQEVVFSRAKRVLQKDIHNLTSKDSELLMNYGLENLHSNETWARIIGKTLTQGGQEPSGTPMAVNSGSQTGLGFRMGENNQIEIVDMDVETKLSGTPMTENTGLQTGLSYGIGCTYGDVDILDIEMG